MGSNNLFLPGEIWRHIVEYLPARDVYSLAVKEPYLQYLSPFAWDRCQQQYCFSKLGTDHQISVLRKLFFQGTDAALGRLKTLLRRFNGCLYGDFRLKLVKRATILNDEDLAYLCTSKTSNFQSAVGLVIAVKHR